MTIRKNIKSLTREEKKAFIKALKRLKVLNYNWYPAVHARVMSEMVGSPSMTRNGAHRGPIFLPWHRKFIREFEEDLQREVERDSQDRGLDLGLPYWDWTESSGIWNEDFMGGNGDPNDENIVKTGPFKYNPPDGWTIVRLGQNGEIELDNEGNPILDPLQRNFGKFSIPTSGNIEIIDMSLPTPQEVEEAISVVPYDCSPWYAYSDPLRSFRSKLEGWDSDPSGRKSHLHNVVHRWINGSMLTMTSPNDPVFFLHHSNIDRIWARWQDEHPDQRYPKHGEITDDETGQPIKYYNLHDQLYPWNDGSTIESMMDHRKLGYTYDKYD